MSQKYPSHVYFLFFFFFFFHLTLCPLLQETLTLSAFALFLKYCLFQASLLPAEDSQSP